MKIPNANRYQTRHANLHSNTYNHGNRPTMDYHRPNPTQHQPSNNGDDFSNSGLFKVACVAVSVLFLAFIR